MTSREPLVGDIWLAYVEFSDHPGVGKVRPVVVVDVRQDVCVVVAAKVPTKDLCADGSGMCIPIIDWQTYGLRKPSYIRLDQKLELAFERLLRDEPIGTLPTSYVEIIFSALNRIQ